ncbi:hypothetical protein [Algibacter sp. L1A34]|uniref:hypothetical protein n=1 Tax=Algibacter sp. L1A34 TaxID=2686365 RepID=UPI00131CDADF|nr:hypothetical protein [Algibacter sp. L1A34]
MLKIWKIKESRSNKLILIADKSIYKGNPKVNDLNRVTPQTTDITFLKDLFSIPYSYITKIENQSGKNYIKIYFGKESEEELYIDNEKTKKEVFEAIKNDNPNLNYSSEIPNMVRYAKPQFFALLIITGVFIWSFYLANQIENGAEYEIIGRRAGIAGIVLAIANLGTFKIISGYLVLLGITVVSLLKRLKSRSEIEFLNR